MFRIRWWHNLSVETFFFVSYVAVPRRNFRKTSGIFIDRCHEHGTWLDADELEEIAGFLLSGGRPGAEEAMRQQAKNDAKQRAALGTYDHQVRPRVESEVVSGKKGVNLLNLLFELLR